MNCPLLLIIKDLIGSCSDVVGLRLQILTTMPLGFNALISLKSWEVLPTCSVCTQMISPFLSPLLSLFAVSLFLSCICACVVCVTAAYRGCENVCPWLHPWGVNLSYLHIWSTFCLVQSLRSPMEGGKAGGQMPSVWFLTTPTPCLSTPRPTAGCDTHFPQQHYKVSS